jgi:hypothetical protein
MKEYQSEEIRNFALLGHASSGKTMLSEAILVNAGIIGRLGSIANGSTFSDYTDEEKKRQISIQTSLMNCDWNGKKLNYMIILTDCLRISVACGHQNSLLSHRSHSEGWCNRTDKPELSSSSDKAKMVLSKAG